MNLHSLKNTPGAKHRRKRVGRGHGSGMGKTSGKGHKGQMARTGHKHKVLFEGGQLRLIQRIPRRGFTNFCRKEMLPVNLWQLEKAFENGADVSLAAMAAAGLVAFPNWAPNMQDGNIIENVWPRAVRELDERCHAEESAGGAGDRSSLREGRRDRATQAPRCRIR